MSRTSSQLVSQGFSLAAPGAYATGQAGSYEIRHATEVPAAALEVFYERMFPSRAAFLKRHWRWLYRVGTYEWAPAPLVAVSGNQVLGHAGTIPVTLRRAHEERNAAWVVDLAILPGQQRRGVGMALTRATAERCLNLGFCNERSLGTVLKNGWKLRLHTQSFQLLLRPECHSRVQRRWLTFPARLAGLTTRAIWWARTLSRRGLLAAPVTGDELVAIATGNDSPLLRVPRSNDFLRWRIGAHPHPEEHVVLRFADARRGDISAIARLSEDAGYRRLHLLALHGDLSEAGALSGFFAAVIRWALGAQAHRVLMVTSVPAIARIARWWLPLSQRLRFVYYADTPAGWDYLEGTDHAWECIDNDFDLA